MSYVTVAIVNELEVTLQPDQKKSVQWEYRFEWGRFQWIPELIYRSSESWLPFKKNDAILCDIRKLKEGTVAEIALKNTSSKTESVTLLLLLHINDYVDPEKHPEFQVTDIEGHLDDEFKLVRTERIWKEASEIQQEIPAYWLDNANDSSPGGMANMGEFIQKETSVFDITSSDIVITHQKTYATLYELDRYLQAFKCDSLNITYVGIDTGENLISVCKFLNQSTLKSKRINILWTKWDRPYASSVVDFLNESVLKTFDIDYTYNGEDDVYNYPSHKRADLMIMTYVTPWIPNFLEDLAPYSQMILKHNSTLMVVNPKSTAEISRDYRSIERIPKPEDWKHLYLHVAHNQHPRPDYPLEGCKSTMYKFEGMDNTPAEKLPGKTPLTDLEGQQNSYECWLKSFDSRKSSYERRQTDDLFEDLLREYETENEVFYVDTMAPGTPPLSSPANFTLNDLTNRLSIIPQDSVRWKSINQRFKDIHSPVEFLKHDKRRRITLFVKNADVLTRKEQIDFCREVHDVYQKLRIVFVRKGWTMEDMKANRGDYPQSISDTEDLKFIEIASARVINSCLGKNHVMALKDSKVVEALSENCEFSVYQVVQGEELIYQVDCFSIDFLRSVVNKVHLREGNMSNITLRVNQQDHKVIFKKIDWERFRNEGQSP